eukprot:COSAG01_NODE_50450_length_363_cov_0.977273_1_plen_34_part_01
MAGAGSQAQAQQTSSVENNTAPPPRVHKHVGGRC